MQQEVKDSRCEPKPLDSRAYAFSHYSEDTNDDGTSGHHKYILSWDKTVTSKTCLCNYFVINV